MVLSRYQTCLARTEFWRCEWSPVTGLAAHGSLGGNPWTPPTSPSTGTGGSCGEIIFLCKSELGRQTDHPDVSKIKKMTPAYTFLKHTFAESVENHAGMETIGEKYPCGFTEEHLASTSARLGAELYTLDQDGERANVLVVRGGVDKLLGGKGGADRLLVESLAQAYDTRFLNTRRNLVQNKHGRHNNCYADVAQEPEIEAGKGTVVAFDTTPEMSKMRAALPNMLGPQASNLFAGDQPVH